MTSTTKRIAERLPEFYKTWSEDSILYKFLNSFGKTLNESEKDLFRIMRAHWIDTAQGVDLDKLASIFNLARQPGEIDRPFRRRIRRAIQEYKGGGTRAAMELALKALFGSYGEKVQLVEFPPTPISFEIEAVSGDTWRAASLGIADVTPTVTMRVQTREGEVRDPKVANLSVNKSVGIKGLLKSGQELTLSNGKARIDGADAIEDSTDGQVPAILRRGSEWQYTEFLHGKLGVFDSGVFDESFFATPLPKVKIRFDWITQKASTVEVRIPRAAMETTGMREDEVVRTLNAIKAAGIEVSVKIQEVKPEAMPVVIPTVVVPAAPEPPIPQPFLKKVEETIA